MAELNLEISLVAIWSNEDVHVSRGLPDARLLDAHIKALRGLYKADVRLAHNQLGSGCIKVLSQG